MVSRHQELPEVATFKPSKPLTNNYVHKHSLSDTRGGSPRNADLDLDEEDYRDLEGPLVVGLPQQVLVPNEAPSDDDDADFEEFVQNDDDDADSVDNTNLQRLKPTRRKL